MKETQVMDIRTKNDLGNVIKNTALVVAILVAAPVYAAISYF